MQLFEKVDSTVITNFRSYQLNPIVNKYLGGDYFLDFEGILILKKKGKNIWLSHPFNYNQSKKLFSKKLIVKKYDTRKDLEIELTKGNGKKIGFDGRFMSVSSLKNLKKLMKGKRLIDVSAELAKTREVKSKNEIKNLAMAVKETKKVIQKAKKKVKKGISEKEVADFFKNEFEKDGFGTAFCIVAFGENAKNLHHVPSEKKLTEGQILFDIGAKKNGYVADVSESFWFGKANEDYEKELFRVKVFLEKARQKIREGIKAKELWKEVKGLKLPHALGHGIGLEEHDIPSGIGEKSNWKLKTGMVLAIEVGEYKKFGIRVERDYLVTKKGFEEL